MESADRDARRLVLVGAGHAHLYTLKRAGELAERGIRLTLVSPELFWYSGLATGMVGGRYDADDDRVDVRHLVEEGGGRYVQGYVTGIDRARRRLSLDSGAILHYDVVSLDVGSTVPLDAVPGAADAAVPVKPISGLWSLRRDLERRFSTGARPRILVIGDGAGAVELAANLERLARRRGASAAVRLAGRADRLLPGAPASAGPKAERLLRRRGVCISLGSSVVRVEPGAAHTADGERLDADVIVAAYGLVPSTLPRSAGLPVAKDGAMIVDDRLRSPADSRIFGAGDCIALRDHDLARVGVYAIRQAPVLYHNLVATIEGGSLRSFEPQKRFLLILNLAEGVGLATWGPFSWIGRLPFRLKQWIDLRFLRNYQRP